MITLCPMHTFRICVSDRLRAVGSGAAGAAWAAPLYWPFDFLPFDYERAGGLHEQGTTRTLLSCTGSVELLCLPSETCSRSVPGSHPFFSARTRRSYVSESVDTL